MPPVRMRGDGRKAKDPKKVLLRLLGYMKQYRVTLIAVVFCIILTAVASAASSQSLGKVVDDYITPMLSQTNPDFAPLVKFLTMNKSGYDFNVPFEPKAAFMGTIEDRADSI